MLPKLPNDILIKILSINEENNFKEHKKKFNPVLEQLENLDEEIYFYYDFDIMDEDEILINRTNFVLTYLYDIK